MPASSMTAGPVATDRRALLVATFTATAIFILMIWSYSAIRATATCHSTQGHVKVGASLNGLVCVYHDGVTRVGG